MGDFDNRSVEAPELLALAADVNAILAGAEVCAAWSGHAAAFAAVLRRAYALADLDTLRLAADVYHDAERQLLAASDEFRLRASGERAAAARRHAVAIAVRCSHCAAEPGEPCRTAGRSYPRGSRDHAVRYRAGAGQLAIAAAL